MTRHIPNFFTILNLVCGLVGIYWVLLTDHTLAFYFVLMGAFFDLFDGMFARILNVQSKMGKELDSLADLVTFGLLPSFFLLQWIRILDPDTPWYWLSLSVAVFSAYRLANFNIDETQESDFKGVPTPANALMLTSLYLLTDIIFIHWILIGLALFSSYLLVCPWRFLSLKFKSLSWKENRTRWIFVILAFLLIFSFQRESIPLLVPFYIVYSTTISLIGVN